MNCIQCITHVVHCIKWKDEWMSFRLNKGMNPMFKSRYHIRLNISWSSKSLICNIHIPRDDVIQWCFMLCVIEKENSARHQTTWYLSTTAHVYIMQRISFCKKSGSLILSHAYWGWWSINARRPWWWWYHLIWKKLGESKTTNNIDTINSHVSGPRKVKCKAHNA